MNQTVLITGAGSGFGLGASLELARRGYDVIATTQILAQITGVKAAAEAAGVELRVEKLDVQDSADRKRAEDWDVDVLVNNAGIGESGPLAEISVDLVRANFETNVFGALELTQGVLKGYAEEGRGKDCQSLFYCRKNHHSLLRTLLHDQACAGGRFGGSQS